MSLNPENKLLVVAGPTAVGKSELAVRLARALDTVIINADSRQVFREMNIGTAKPSEYDLRSVKHFFVNSKNLEEDFSAGIFEREALDVLGKIYQETHLALMSGGSGLYIQALCDGFDEIPEVDPNIRKELNADLQTLGLPRLKEELKDRDPEYWKIVDQSNTQRIMRALEVIRTTNEPFSTFHTRKPAYRQFTAIKIGLDRPRGELYARINERMDRMIENGLFEEAADLKKFRNTNAMQTLGYREVFGYLDGDYDKEEAIRLLKRNSRRYAKRQLSWFHKDASFTWFHPDEFDRILEFANKKIQGD